MGKLIEAVKCAEIISEKLNIPLADLVDVFAEIPTAEVVEVKHGYWVYEVKYYSCSNCAGKRFNLLLGCDAEYCPYCGAKMDGTPKERGGEK